MTHLRRVGVPGVQAVVQKSLDIRIQLIQLRQHLFLTLIKFFDESTLVLRIWHLVLLLAGKGRRGRTRGDWHQAALFIGCGVPGF